MASSYTDIGTELMTTGENAGNWGTKTNTNLQILEEALRGYVSQSIAGGVQTTALTYTDGTVGDAARNMIIALTGTITGNQTITVPAVEKMWIIDNQTSGAYTVNIKVSGQTGVTWGASDKGTKILYGNGTDVVDTDIGGVGAYDLNGATLTLDLDGDTDITADTDDQIDIRIAGADDFQFTANTFTAQSGSTIAAQALTATTITASGIIKTDDTTAATSTTDGSLQTDGGLSVAADAIIGDDLKLLSDSAVLSFGADSDTTLTHTDGTGLTLNGANKLLFRDTGLTIGSNADGDLDIVSDGTAVDSINIESGGGITLDAGTAGSGVIYEDDGTEMLRIYNSSSDVYIESKVSDKDILIRGNDGGVATTALTFDMSDAGKATFSGNVVVSGDLTVSGDDITMGTNTAGNLLVADGTNFNSIAAGSLSEISTIANDDVFLAVDTSGGGLKKVARSTVVSGLATSAAISDIVEDTSPQLGGDLDTNSANILIDDAHFIADENGNEQIIFQTTGSAVNQFDITNAASGNAPLLSATGGDSNIDLEILAKGTGHVTIKGGTNSGAIQFNCESNSHGQIVIAQAHSAGVTNTLTLPAGASSTLVSLVSTDTLTNKTLTSPKVNEDVAVTSTATELNKLDGATVTTAEINLIDGGTARGTTAVADADGILHNDAGTMRMTSAATFKTYFTSGVSSAADDLTVGDDAVNLTTSSGNITIDAAANNTDIIFKGTDATADITMLTLDGSEAGAATFNDKVIATELDISGNMDIDGTSNLDAVDIDGAVQLDATLTIGANDQGYDVILYGDTASANVTWDTSADDLIFNGGAGLIVPDGQLTLGSTAVSSTAAELNLLDNVSGLVQADLTKLAAVDSTAAELNIVDGGTSATSTTVADADRVVLNDNGTMVQVAMTDIKTYIGGGTSWQAVKTGNFTAAAGQGVFANTTSSAFTVTLPAGSIGDEVSIIDYAGTFDSNNLTVAANGSEKIHASTDDLTVATERAGFTLVFTDSTQGWLLKDK